MTTATQEKPTETVEAKPFTLAKPRTAALKSGMPKDGLGILTGLPKGGKTTLAVSIPGAILLELERGGADRVAGWIQDVDSLETFREAVQAAAAHPDVKAIVIDSVDIFHEWTDVEVSAPFGLETVNEPQEGVNTFEVWKAIRLRYEKLVSYLKQSGKLAILIAHSKEPKIDKDGKVIIPAGITIPGKLGGFLAAEADFIGNVYKEQVGTKTKHFLSFRGGPLGTWGSRIPEIEDKIIELPRENPWSAVEAIFNKEKVWPTADGAPEAKKDEAVNSKKGGKLK